MAAGLTVIDAVFECEEIVHRPGERPSWRFRCPHCDEWHTTARARAVA